MARHEPAILRGHLSTGAFPSLVPSVRRVVAPNPGPFTGPGTNTWIVGEGPAVAVIDPGPDDDRHLAALEQALRATAVGVVLVTHGHAAHLALAERFPALHGARVGRH